MCAPDVGRACIRLSESDTETGRTGAFSFVLPFLMIRYLQGSLEVIHLPRMGQTVDKSSAYGSRKLIG
jgi:hypothetical protein